MKHSLLALAVALSLAACGKREDVPYMQTQQQAPAPVVVNQAPAQDSSLMPALMGAAAGYMLGSSGRQATPAPQVIERHTTRIIERPSTPTQAAAQVSKAATPSVPAPSPSVIPRPTMQAKPSVGSYSPSTKPYSYSPPSMSRSSPPSFRR